MTDWASKIDASKYNWFAHKLATALSNISIKPYAISEDGHSAYKTIDMEGNDGNQFHLKETGDETFEIGSKYVVVTVSSFEQAFDTLVHMIRSFRINGAETLKFFSPIIPKRAVVFANLETCENINCRYMIEYLPMSDVIAQRWDVIISRS